MKSVVHAAIPVIFFAPAVSTYFGGPYIGIGVSGVFLLYHYFHSHFDKYIMVEPIKDDPMDIVLQTTPVIQLARALGPKTPLH